ncbi:MAG: PIN domain-containing protein [Myxococcales bacterium]|nr:PIN domain-containing protein [Myxococcales bacterium]
METIVHLDTHVVVWLAAGDRGRLRRVWPRLLRSKLVISPMVALELEYLHEIGRLRDKGAVVLKQLVSSVGVQMALTPFPTVVEEALKIRWTRDPFDRFIVAQAIAEGVPLLTKDKRIRDHVATAVWAP